MLYRRPIDTDRFSSVLRVKGIDLEHRKVLLTRFSNSDQEKDMTLPTNCGGVGRIHHFRRTQGDVWPDNPLPIDPAAHMLRLPFTDELQVQVFQNAVCSWRCWYCYVDYALLSADRRHASFMSVKKLLDLFLAEKRQPRIIDISGGQPDLIPEWGLWLADEIKRRGLDQTFYLWSDDNLSNDYLWRYLSADEVDRLSSFVNYGRVGCFKGFDEHSFSFNTKADPELFRNQFSLAKRLVSAGFDLYGYATFTSDEDLEITGRMKDFVDRLQSEVHPIFPLRTVPLRIKKYTPMVKRMGEPEERAIRIQNIAIGTGI